MDALADDNTYAAWGRVPTSAIYRLPVAAETSASSVRGLTADPLIGRVHGRALDTTEITIRRERATGVTSSRAAAGALLGAGVLLMCAPALYEPTTYSIAIAAAHDASVAEPAAYLAFKDLGRWLAADDVQVADMVKIGRTTPYAWKRDGREPRAATAQRIYEHHATMDALERRLGEEGLRRWLHEGVPTRRDVVLAGRMTDLEGDVHEVLFHRPVEQQIDLAAAPEDTMSAVVSVHAPPVRPSGRRPRRPPA